MTRAHPQTQADLPVSHATRSPWRVTRARGAGAALGIGMALCALLPFPASAAGEPPPCQVSVDISPARAFTGQQVRYAVRIVRRHDVEHMDWEAPLRFPELRMEWLPGRAEDTRMQYRGVRLYAREEHRALFAERPGRYVVPEAVLRCRLKSRGPEAATASPDSERIVVPAVALEVREPPTEGRPSEWRGLIGPISVRSVANPAELSLGGSSRVSVAIRGTGNLWSLRAPLPGIEAIEGADLHPRKPELDLDTGESLGVRRFFRFDLVPRRAGSLLLPAVRIPYFDPESGRYAVASSEAIELRVSERPARESVGATARAEGSSGEKPADDGAPAGDAAGWILFGAVALAVAGAAAGWLRRPRDPALVDLELALEDAGAAEEAGDPLAEARALTRALEAAVAIYERRDRIPGPGATRGAGDSGGLRREAAKELEALDWIRFSDELGHPDRRTVRALIQRLTKPIRS